MKGLLAIFAVLLLAATPVWSFMGAGVSRGQVVELIVQTTDTAAPYYRYTASASQTEFYGNDDHSNSLTFGSKTIVVSVNGVIQNDSAYTKSNSPDKVTFGSGLNENDIVQVFVMSGASGPAGADGTVGTAGTNGTDGTDGTDGVKSLVKTTTESPGGNCAAGGYKVEVGIDDDDDSVLDAGEVDSTVYVCNGEDGADGSPTAIDAVEFVIDGGASAITTGVKGYIEIPFVCTIEAVTLVANETGSITVDIWKDTYANYPPTDVDSITAAATPYISSGTKYQDTTLTGWTTSVSAGDILAYNVDSVSTIKKITISLKVEK